MEDFQNILLSPGPGIPDESGLLKNAIKHYSPTKKILGICLGQQAIAEVLSDMDAEIAALEQRRGKAKAIKRGMMQQLLTGRIRLVDPSTPVEASA